MSNVNMQNLFSLMILVSLVQGIKSDWDYVTEQRQIATSLLLENNLDESQDKTVITTGITVDYEKFDDYELKKLFVKNFKTYKHLEKEENKNEVWQTLNPQRKTRAVVNQTTGPVECHTCHATGTKTSDDRCYRGVKIPTKRCADAEYCYTEIHPEYLRRGCILPGRVNRTFVCKCPLCNDKPSTESLHYEYSKISDWAYDNGRLAKRLLGMDLMCKVCETKGIDPTMDQNCRSGKNSDYMVCPHNHICYTNIDDETDFVSRGCIPRPAFNPIFFFCNTSECNKDTFSRPKRRIQQEEIKIKIPNTNLKSVFTLQKSRSPSTDTVNLCLILLTFGKLYMEVSHHFQKFVYIYKKKTT